MNERRPIIPVVAGLLAALILVVAGGCGNPLALTDLVDGPDGESLSVTPGGGTVVANNSVTLVARGGIPPYTYSLAAGSGSVSGNVYTASATPGTERVAVSDAAGSSVAVVFEVDAGTVGFGITPPSQTVYTGDTITFNPIGGTGPTFTYAITTNGSGADPMIGNSYVAGPLDAVTPSALDTITITDTSDMSTATATITVVQKDLSINNPTATVVVGGSLDLVNVGGTGDFSYEVTTNNSIVPGDMTLSSYASGAPATYVAGTTGGVTDVVTMTDAYDGRTRTATISVVAATFVADVDYDVDPVTLVSAAPYRTGEAFIASSGVTNIGTAAGGADLVWTAYASTDTAIGGADYAVASGTFVGGLATGGGATPIPINGTWPPVPGDYYLLIDVRADDDVIRTNNVEQTAGTSHVASSVAISPSAFTAYTGQTIAFTATGEPPLTYSISSNGSGASPMAGATYVAGPNPGTDTVRVTDSYGDFVEATITVQSAPLPTAVDYVVDGVNVSVVGTAGGDAVSGSIDLRNAGTGNGSQTVSFTIYASLDATIGGTDTIMDSGTTGPLAASGTANVAFSGFWPSKAGDYYVIAAVTAVDDTNTGNNSADNGSATTITGPPPEDVDYVIVSVSDPGVAVVAGGALAESFVLRNAGTVSGGDTVYWTAYVSADLIIDPGVDPILGTGTHVALAPGVVNEVTIPFVGAWPSSAGTWYLIVAASASDEIVPGAQGTSAAVTVANPDVDYVIDPIVQADPSPPAGSVNSEGFTIRNLGADAGSAPVYWKVFLSADAVLDPATDDLLASDTIATGLAGDDAGVGGPDESSIAVGGTWPEAPGTWYLIATAAASDDAVPGAQAVSPAYGVYSATLNVDYRVSVPPSGGTVVPGASIAESFTVENQGSQAGVASVSWSAYRSTDTVFDGSDTPVDAGSVPGFAPGAPNAVTIPIDAGSWPVAAGTYYLIVRLQSTDDTDLTNNAGVSAAYVVYQAGIADYTVSAISTNEAIIRTDSPILESFTVTNLGQNAGPSYDWNVWLSTDATLGSDTLVDTRSGLAALGSGGATSFDITGLWPATAGSYYLIVELVVSDDNGTNDTVAGGPYAVQDPPNYSVYDTLPYIPAVHEGGYTGEAFDAIAAGHDFTIARVSGPVGDSPVTWRIFVSTDAALDGGDTQLASGVVPAANISPSLTIPFPTGLSLPASWGYHHVIVSVSALDDTNASDNTYISGPIPVWSQNASGESDTTEDDLAFEQADDLAVLLNPGDLIQIQGLADIAGSRDSFVLTTGTSADGVGADTTELSIRLQWNTVDPGAGTRNDLDIQVWASDGSSIGVSNDDPVGPPSDPPANYQEPSDGTWLVISSPDVQPGETYYVDIVSFSAQDPGDDYTLSIQAGP